MLKKLIVLLAIAVMGIGGTVHAAFYDNSQQYEVLEITDGGTYYLDRASLKEATPIQGNSFAATFSIISVVPQTTGVPVAERTYFTVYYNTDSKTAFYRVNGAGIADSNGNVAKYTKTKGAASMSKNVVRNSNMYYVADACYEYFNGTHFFSNINAQ